MNGKLIATATALIAMSILTLPSMVLADNGKGTSKSNQSVVVQPSDSKLSTVKTFVTTAVRGVTSQSSAVKSLTTSLIVLDYLDAAKKEGVTPRDMVNAYKDVGEIIKWASNNKDAALNATTEGMTKASAVGWNGMMKTTGASTMINKATGGKYSGQINSQQINKAGQNMADRLWGR